MKRLLSASLAAALLVVAVAACGSGSSGTATLTAHESPSSPSTGGRETAHQIVNDSDAELAYISVSTMAPAEVCEYPDSGKVGSFGGRGESRIRHLTELSAAVDYWKGE